MLSAAVVAAGMALSVIACLACRLCAREVSLHTDCCSFCWSTPLAEEGRPLLRPVSAPAAAAAEEDAPDADGGPREEHAASRKARIARMLARGPVPRATPVVVEVSAEESGEEEWTSVA